MRRLESRETCTVVIKLKFSAIAGDVFVFLFFYFILRLNKEKLTEWDSNQQPQPMQIMYLFNVNVFLFVLFFGFNKDNLTAKLMQENMSRHISCQINPINAKRPHVALFTKILGEMATELEKLGSAISRLATVIKFN